MFFSACHGSVKRYKSSQDVELYDFEYSTSENLRNDFNDLQKIREGAFCFINRFYENPLSNIIKWNREIAFNAMRHL